MNGNLPVILTGVLFLIVGFLCLLFPYKIQKKFLKLYEENMFMKKVSIKPLWVESSGYIWSLRIVGVIGIAVFLLSIYVCFG